MEAFWGSKGAKELRRSGNMFAKKKRSCLHRGTLLNEQIHLEY